MRHGNGDEKALKWLRGHITTFRKLFWGFHRPAEEVISRNGTTCLFPANAGATRMCVSSWFRAACLGQICMVAPTASSTQRGHR
eukprot:3294213-Pyramimonas_sp.AAC.1